MNLETLQYLAKHHQIFLSPVQNYESAKEHSEFLDSLIGIQSTVIETVLLEKAQTLRPEGSVRTYAQALHGNAQTWIGLGAQIVQTPYSEFYQMTKERAPVAFEHWVDLGAGYGRLGIVMESLFENIRYTGYELVKERIEEGRRIFSMLGLKNSSLVHADLSSTEFKTPKADVYFIYDFGSIEAIEKVLNDLKDVARSSPITVIARGRSSRDSIEQGHPWLASVNSPIHYQTYSIYRS